MAEEYLIVVDVQNDFVTGSLGSGEAVNIIPNVLQRVSNFKGNICFTKDTHDEEYLSTQEGKNLPVVHCIKGTKGWELIDELKQLQEQRQLKVYEKNTFGSIKLAESLRKEYEEKGIKSIELIGLCTDICVVSNALLLKAVLPEVPVYVNAACCAGVTPDSHKAALETMKSCQIHITNQDTGKVMA